MIKVILGYGLNGGFGGIRTYEITTFEDDTTHEDWIDEAYSLAIQEYESYEGLNGLKDFDDIAKDFQHLDENDEDDYDELCSIYTEEREGWLEYTAEIWTEERENYLTERYHVYHNY